jgi:hypothetical protein
MMAQKYLIIALIIIGSLAVTHTINADQTSDTLSKIERMVSLGENAEPSLGKSVVDGIEKNSTKISKEIILKLKDKTITDNQLSVYVWALGLTKDQAAFSPIEEVYQQSKSDMVKGNCLRAFAMIGGKRSEELLLSALNATSDKGMRFNILNLLGQLQCEAALSNAEEILKQDPKELYWQSIFFFGKMGDKAVPFLLKRINDSDYNVRANAINVLGQWLIPSEAAKPLLDQFWTEKDEEIRGMTLRSLERTITDLNQMQTVFEEIVAKEKNDKFVVYARETLGNMDNMKSAIASFAEKKQITGSNFQSEYQLLFKSAGKEGNYENLAVTSSVRDEAKLKALRERILQRDSDEAFYDYQKVNDIIIRNRLARK